MDLQQIKSLYNKNQNVWINVRDFSLLYRKITEEDKISLFLQAEDQGLDSQEFYVEKVMNSIIDWKGVKLIDINHDPYDDDAYEEIEGFDPDLFDMLLGNDMDIVEDIFKAVDLIDKKYEKKKKKIIDEVKRIINEMEYEKICKEFSKNIKQKVTMTILDSLAFDIYQRCVIENKIEWNDVIFWGDIKGYPDMPLLCELMLVMRQEYAIQYDKREDRKKEIQKRSSDVSKLMARKFRGTDGE